MSRRGFPLQEREAAEVARDALAPLNGTKTHPLSRHAIGELRDIAAAPVPRSGVNPGVANRLLREALVEQVMLPSPFKTHQGGKCAHLRITDAGRAALDNLKPAAEG